MAQTAGGHDPGKIVCDLTIALAIGGDCLANIAMLRGQPGVFGLAAYSIGFGV